MPGVFVLGRAFDPFNGLVRWFLRSDSFPREWDGAELTATAYRDPAQGLDFERRCHCSICEHIAGMGEEQAGEYLSMVYRKALPAVRP